MAEVWSDKPFVGIRIGQNAHGVVRMVIDLKPDACPSVALAPVAAYQHRLVLDLHPAREIDPLEALIADRLQDDAQYAVPQPLPRVPWQMRRSLPSPHPRPTTRWAN